MKGQYHNNFKPDDVDSRITSIVTEPKFGIGERCILLQTEQGNVLWDLITWLDDDTVQYINARGGLKVIVISHPHFYTTHLHWAKVFDCPVYIAAEDEEWVSMADEEGRRKLIEGASKEILPGVTAVKLGGHFPGSLVLNWDKKLFIADTLLTVPVSPSQCVSMGKMFANASQSALYHVDRPPGTTSYAFMWSIPNFIPLPPSQIFKMWQALKPYDFESTHGAFVGMDVRDKNTKFRVLESMKIQARAEGYADHDILKESWP